MAEEAIMRTQWFIQAVSLKLALAFLAIAGVSLGECKI